MNAFRQARPGGEKREEAPHDTGSVPEESLRAPRRLGRGIRRLPRPAQLQRGIIILPSAFTLGNLFFGIYAIVAASRGDTIWAAWFIVFAGILDGLDGRVARFTRTGSAFGAELDSLVDVISFGVAPGLIMYEIFFTDGTWSWTISFVFVTAVVIRLARFNVEQAGFAKSQFNGLPSPAAGMLLATYYPFSQTDLFVTYLGDLPWPQIMAISMILLGILLVSHIPYAVVPKIGFRNVRGLSTLALMAASLIAALTVPSYFFFPFLVTYAMWGLIRSVLLGLWDRLPDRDPLLDLEEDELDESGAELRSLDYTELTQNRGGPRSHPEE